jgi:hypothetical protein
MTFAEMASISPALSEFFPRLTDFDPNQRVGRVS